MKLAFWTVVTMTAVVIGVTIWEAAFGNEIGRVFFGTSIAIAGIFLIALWPPDTYHERE